MGDLPSQTDLSLIKPHFTPSHLQESSRIQSVIKALGLLPHIEGGYYNQTDESTTIIPSPYPDTPLSEHTVSLAGVRPGFQASFRRLSTTIFYYLTPSRPQGTFHVNRSRIHHTLHRGRGRYVLIHPGGRVETFIVGQNVEEGEKLQWVVEGGVWKASFLLDNNDGKDGQNEGLLISETVVPGFEFVDHEFLSRSKCRELLSKDKAAALDWLVRDDSELESDGEKHKDEEELCTASTGSLATNDDVDVDIVDPHESCDFTPSHYVDGNDNHGNLVGASNTGCEKRTRSCVLA